MPEGGGSGNFAKGLTVKNDKVKLLAGSQKYFLIDDVTVCVRSLDDNQSQNLMVAMVAILDVLSLKSLFYDIINKLLLKNAFC